MGVSLESVKSLKVVIDLSKYEAEKNITVTLSADYLSKPIVLNIMYDSDNGDTKMTSEIKNVFSFSFESKTVDKSKNIDLNVKVDSEKLELNVNAVIAPNGKTVADDTAYENCDDSTVSIDIKTSAGNMSFEIKGAETKSGGAKATLLGKIDGTLLGRSEYEIAKINGQFTVGAAEEGKIPAFDCKVSVRSDRYADIELNFDPAKFKEVGKSPLEGSVSFGINGSETAKGSAKISVNTKSYADGKSSYELKVNIVYGTKADEKAEISALVSFPSAVKITPNATEKKYLDRYDYLINNENKVENDFEGYEGLIEAYIKQHASELGWEIQYLAYDEKTGIGCVFTVTSSGSEIEISRDYLIDYETYVNYFPIINKDGTVSNPQFSGPVDSCS